MRKILKIGAIANDGTGDKLRNAFDLIQQNFVDMYGFFGDGESITSLSARQKLEVQTASEIAQEIANAVKPSNDHIASNLNPHNVTKDQVGLSNVDNTSDLNKPISTDTQKALDEKANSIDVVLEISAAINAIPEPTQYSLPTASPAVLGGVRIGDNLSIENGILSAIIPDVPDVDLSGLMVKNKNLSDLSDKEQARSNLGVPSTIEVATAIEDSLTPNATETTAGKAKIATSAATQEGTSDTDIVTPKKLRGASFTLGQTRKSTTIVNGTTYTNSTGKAKEVTLVFGATGVGQASVSVNIINTQGASFKNEWLVGASSSAPRETMILVVLAGESFTTSWSGVATLVSSSEIS